ncbi:MAG: GntR family transcriptional regulator [Gammaproteobacteria bacterium]|nr:GntR family transcriptional regulator [Gammaproteobacteria bacterium]
MDDVNPDSGLRKIEREPLWDIAHAQLRDALLAGRFEPGSTLTLRYLAEIFGISVTPVRDAVTRLAAQGVLKQGPRNRAVVPAITADELKQLAIVRCELEGRAAFEAASRINDASLEKVERSLSAMQKSMADGDRQAYLRAHRGFHFAIYEASQVPLLIEMIENLWLRIGPTLLYVMPIYVHNIKSVNHHVGAFEALKVRDAVACRREISNDIEKAANYLNSLIDETGRIRKPDAR